MIPKIKSFVGKVILSLNFAAIIVAASNLIPARTLRADNCGEVPGCWQDAFVPCQKGTCIDMGLFYGNYPKVIVPNCTGANSGQTPSDFSTNIIPNWYMCVALTPDQPTCKEELHLCSNITIYFGGVCDAAHYCASDTIEECIATSGTNCNP